MRPMYPVNVAAGTVWDTSRDEWVHAPPATRAIAELYRRHACEVEVELTSQACHPAIKTGMTYVVGHFCSHIDWNSIPGSTGDHVAGASAAYENQALRESKKVLNSGFRNPGTEFRILWLCSLGSWFQLLVGFRFLEQYSGFQRPGFQISR